MGVLVLVASGCATQENRWSSRDYLRGTENEILLSRPFEQAAQAVSQELEARHLPQVDLRRAPDDSPVLVFSTPVWVGSNRRAGPGSVFYAKLTAIDASHTRVELLGKPYLGGQPPCTDADASFGLSCPQPAKGWGMWGLDERANGRSQAHVVARVLEKLRELP